jgi:hypothetical protein
MRIGDIVEIEFRDHAHGHETIVFFVWGRLVKRSKTDWVIAVWDYTKPPKRRSLANDPNVETFTIARDAVISYRVLA